MKTTIKKNVKAGFSLVEMLVVIAVIGIIAAIAVPTIGSITSQANTNKAKRNAQNLASVYSSAIAAGASFSTQADAGAIVDSLVLGVSGADSFATTKFQVPNMSEDEKNNAEVYLEFVAKGAGPGDQPQLNYK